MKRTNFSINPIKVNIFKKSSFKESKLIANTERLERTSRKIQDAYRVTVETEQVHKFLLNFSVDFKEKILNFGP